MAGLSELFRPQHRHDEVDEAAEGDETDEDRFHGGSVADSPHFLAEPRIRGSENKEHDGERDECDVGSKIHAATLARAFRTA
jgi:hypothetical protein